MVFEKTREAFMDIMGFEEEEIQLSSLLYDELDVDSLDMSQILLALENAYNIDIENDAVEEMNTVEDLVNHTKELIG